MRVFVAGGSGAIGGHLVPRLVAGGHEVVASARSAPKLAQIDHWGADDVVMDGLNATSVNAAVVAARPEVVVHQMTALAGTTDLRHFRSQLRVDQPPPNRRDSEPARTRRRRLARAA
jgi:nucleoside-diphosphate-sugar epimerase